MPAPDQVEKDRAMGPMETGIARRSSLKGRKRAIVNQTNIVTVSKATFGKTSARRVWAHTHWLFRLHRYHLELNQTVSLSFTSIIWCQLNSRLMRLVTINIEHPVSSFVVYAQSTSTAISGRIKHPMNRGGYIRTELVSQSLARCIQLQTHARLFVGKRITEVGIPVNRVGRDQKGRISGSRRSTQLFCSEHIKG